MNQESYRNLRIERRTQAIPRRLIPVGIALAGFTLLWVVVPPAALYWLLFLLVALLVWVGSYGWRQALTSFHDLLHKVIQ